MTLEDTEKTAGGEIPGRATFSRQDFMTLTKARLSALVVVTTFFGYLLGARDGAFDWFLLAHTLIGTTLCAFAAAVFNQILEAEADARMERTADRPLPARRIPSELAFLLGWLLAAAGVLHLLMKSTFPAACLAAATIAIYIFVYTPLKTRSSANTLVGAVSGAVPPLIGWTAAGRALDTWGAFFLFGLLFFWQLPHFLAINWMYRDQYVRGGFVMWSNEDESGKKTGGLAVLFSAMMLAFMIVPFAVGLTHPAYLVGALVLNGIMLALALRFYREPRRLFARRLFLYTLIYLPTLLALVFFTWR